VSEPFAALLGWIVLANSFSDTMYAVLFGMVAGMMVIISSRELLPTAHRYDPEDCVVTFSYIAGMLIMAASLRSKRASKDWFTFLKWTGPTKTSIRLEWFKSAKKLK